MITDRELLERLVAVEQSNIDLKEVLEEIKRDCKETKAEINKYKGFIGSIWFVVSCLGVFFSAWRFFHKG